MTELWDGDWQPAECPWRMMMEDEQEAVVVPVVVPDVVPESEDNLAMHVGRLHESHEGMRREWEMHREEMGELKGLVNTLLTALQEVEDVAEEIVEEEDVEEAATVAEPTGGHEGKKDHIITRMLRGH